MTAAQARQLSNDSDYSRRRYAVLHSDMETIYKTIEDAARCGEVELEINFCEIPLHMQDLAREILESKGYTVELNIDNGTDWRISW